MALLRSELSITQLQRLLSQRQRDVARLERKREKLEKNLKAVDAALAALGGPSAGRRSGVRAHNQISLDEAIHQVLEKAGKPMRVPDITARVQKLGYRSNSANFRGIVNQTLIKDKRFAAVERGVYGLKK